MAGHPTDITQLVLRFNDALNARDVDAMMALMTPDVVVGYYRRAGALQTGMVPPPEAG